MLGRDRIQISHGQVAALQQVVVEAGCYPLAQRRLRRQGLQRIQRLRAGPVGLESDICRQFDD